MGVLAYVVASFGGLVFLLNCFNLPTDAAFFQNYIYLVAYEEKGIR